MDKEGHRTEGGGTKCAPPSHMVMLPERAHRLRSLRQLRPPTPRIPAGTGHGPNSVRCLHRPQQRRMIAPMRHEPARIFGAAARISSDGLSAYFVKLSTNMDASLDAVLLSTIKLLHFAGIFGPNDDHRLRLSDLLHRGHCQGIHRRQASRTTVADGSFILDPTSFASSGPASIHEPGFGI